MRFSILLLLFTQVVVATSCGQAVEIPADHGGTAETAPTAGAEEVPGPLTALTIVEALALSEKASPVLKEASASLNRAQASVQSAKAYSNPTFEFLGGHQTALPIPTPGVPGSVLHYSVGQTIEIPAERRSRIRASQLDLTGSRYQVASVHLSVVADVKQAFYDVLRRKEQLAQANDNLALVEDLRRRVQMEVQVGEKGKLELTRAEAELARAHAAVRSADVQLANSRAILKAVIGSSSKETFDAQGTLDVAMRIQPLENCASRCCSPIPHWPRQKCKQNAPTPLYSTNKPGAFPNRLHTENTSVNPTSPFIALA